MQFEKGSSRTRSFSGLISILIRLRLNDNNLIVETSG